MCELGWLRGKKKKSRKDFRRQKGTRPTGAQMKTTRVDKKRRGWMKEKEKGRQGIRREVGRFPGGPISWDSHYLPPWIPRTLLCLCILIFYPLSSRCRLSPTFFYTSSSFSSAASHVPPTSVSSWSFFLLLSSLSFYFVSFSFASFLFCFCL